ncbi:hypothetical protein [Acidovorax radicis]|uniref:hypothetical protein n=1 Tax=Acidovorax radicis TaxID=758826 RepID=UPI001CF93727|nr:hypothetical protein [Acidovorax radicis]UCV00301.1 hypothetical protein KI609_05820 [Acidovorax radicis]
MSYYIDPIVITDAQVLSGTSLAEDPTSAWAAGTFAIGDERHVVSTHRVYRDAVGGASSASPETDPTRWKDMRPTNKWAPFDEYTDTAAETTAANIVYVLASRFVNSIALYGLDGAGVAVTVKDAPGGTQIYRYPASGFSQLKRAAKGYWDYAYGERRKRTSLVLRDLPIRPNAEITIEVSATGSQRRAVGMIVRGKWRSLVGVGFGGVLEDAEVNPKTYTYRETQADGRQRLVVRGSSKDLRFSIVMDRENADQAAQAMEDLLSRPVAWVVSTKPGFAGLTAFGIAQRAPIRYRNKLAYIDLSIEGYV